MEPSPSTTISIPLPRSIKERIYIHLTHRAKAITIFVTTATPDDAAAGVPTPFGSFVYSLPDRYNPTQPLSTPLCAEEETIEFSTRLAKLVARRTGLPVYVGCSVSFKSTGLGGSVEEVMEGFGAVVKGVMEGLEGLKKEKGVEERVEGLRIED
ncbi:hypothetical protein QBC38DRAFT_365472 [Podospora fimiseda]|uniref:Uncharacterized protein n=1 Tax=Podospora fimiseda TaxID=252190 RepID=A0AAN7BNL4_9PEZI|nr:hypothetical protein QBC38DRAFT_365472 [Podospora fimiseda]